MEMQEVKSSNIKEVGYSEESKVLFVRFKSGGLYTYNNFEKQTFDEFLNAKSIGAYFSKNIRNHYPTLLVQE